MLRECWNTIPGERCLVAGFEPLLRGMTINSQNRVDLSYVDDIRNFAISANKYTSGMDLFSLDVQRAREHGLPDYNTMRQAFGLPRITSFNEISNDSEVNQLLFNLYNGDIDNIDPAVGAYAEGNFNFFDFFIFYFLFFIFYFLFFIFYFLFFIFYFQFFSVSSQFF